MKEILAAIDWNSVISSLNINGFASVKSVLPDQICDQFIADYDLPGLYRKTVIMERHRFGKGEYKYFDYPLPKIVQELREGVYPVLAPVANSWMGKVRTEVRFPPTFRSLQD